MRGLFLAALLTTTACGPDSASKAMDTGNLASDLAVAAHPEVSTILIATWTEGTATDASWVSYSFGDTSWTTPVIPRDAGPAQAALLGIPADTDVTVAVVNEDGTTQTSASVTARTGSLPDDLPVPTEASWDPTRTSPERWMLITEDAGDHAYEGPFYAVILDREGRIVWYWSVPENRTSMYAQPGWDGTHILVDGDATYQFNDGVTSSVFRVTLDLARLDEISIPKLNFAVDEEVDGSVLYTRYVDSGWALTRHDPDGTDTDLWSCKDYFAPSNFSDAQCLPNTIVWDADRDTVMYSMPHSNTVAEVDIASGKVLKVFGEGTEDWTISPASATPDFQHYANWTPDGTILLSTHVPDEDGQMRAREFAPDDTTKTLTEVWSYGEGGAHYASGSGEAVRLTNGNTLIGYGTDGAVYEVSPEGDLLWDIEWPTEPATVLIGHATLIDDLYALDGETSATP